MKDWQMLCKYDVGICSGYFNPLHDGHLAYLNAAKDKCNKLIVIVNNDEQVKYKGSKSFLNEDVRCSIIENLRCVDVAIVSKDKKESIAATLDYVIQLVRRKDKEAEIAFFNGGDRQSPNREELDVCVRYAVYEVFLDQPKINSSSEILKNAGI
jgi:cytidyltransferase-like protein